MDIIAAISIDRHRKRLQTQGKCSWDKSKGFPQNYRRIEDEKDL